jgi:hypothetical protein
MAGEAVPEMAPGQKLINEGIGAGYTRDEANEWKAQQYQEGLKKGYSMTEMQKYFGDDKEPDTTPLKDHFVKAIEEAKPKDAEGKPKPQTREAQTWFESLEAGLQSSVSGLDLRKAPPEITPNQHGDMAMRILQQAGQLAGDFPAMFVGGAAGGFGGALAGALATANPVGAAAGAVVGGGYGAMALPEALRTWMMDGYEKGEIRDSGDFASRVIHSAWEANKQGVVGGLTAGVGKTVKMAAGTLPALAAEIPTMTIAGAAVQGRTPEPHEFLDGAVMVGGLHLATGGFSKSNPVDGSSLPKKLGDIYRNTGERPGQILEAMDKDIVLKQEILSENPDLPLQAKIEKPVEVEPEPAPAAPPPTPPGEPPSIEDLHKKFNDYIGATPDKAKLPLAERIKEGFDQKYADHLDFTLAMQHAMDEVRATPNAEENPVILTRLHASYMDTLQHFVEKGTIDWETQNKNGESLKEIQDRYATEFPEDKKREGWKAYGIAARALEKAKQKASGSGKLKEISVAGEKIDLDEARQIVEAGKDKYEKYVQARTDYGNRVLDYAHASGYWTPEQLKNMKENNLSYMDMNRLIEPDELTGKKKGGSKAVRELFGEGGLFQDPMLSWVKNTDMILRMAEENHIKKALVKQVALLDAEGNAHPDAWLRKVETDFTPIKIDAKELDAGLRKQGLVLNDQTLEGISVFRPEQKRLGPNRMEVHIDGKREVYEGPSELIDSVNRLKGNSTATDVFGQILKGFSAVERTTTVGTPWFAAKHAWRQQLTAGVFSEYGYGPVDWVKNSWDVSTKPEAKALWNQFFVDGGAVSTIKAFDNTYVESQIYKLDKEVPFMNKVWNKVENAVQLSHWMIVNHDNMIRYSEYKGAVEAGKTRTEAAFAAREVLPDFQKAGLRNAFLFQQTAFLKVHLQGLDRMVQAGAEDVQGYKESGINAMNNTIGNGCDNSPTLTIGRCKLGR